MVDVFSYSTAADSDNGDGGEGLSTGAYLWGSLPGVLCVVANPDLPVRNVATMLSYVAELVLNGVSRARMIVEPWCIG